MAALLDTEMPMCPGPPALPGLLPPLCRGRGLRLRNGNARLLATAGYERGITFARTRLLADTFFGSGSASGARLRFKASIRLMTLGGSAVAAYEPAITRDVRGENGGELAFDAFRGQSGAPQPHGPY